jgi:polyhydroxybutyrate depolymerase
MAPSKRPFVFGLYLWIGTFGLLSCAGGGVRTISGTSPSCEQSNLGPGDYWREIYSGGLERSYKIHVPPGYDKSHPVPVVVNFHGGGGHAENQERVSGMNRVADAHGFIVVYPNGTGGIAGRLLTFNAGVCCGNAKKHNVDDVGFTKNLLDDIGRHFCTDPKRVYATGFSNGALMAYRLACELSDRIAAIGPVGAPIGVDTCNPSRPVPVLHIHGTDDEFSPYYGGVGKGPGSHLFRSVAYTISLWTALNHCASQPKVTFNKGAVICEARERCEGNVSVVACTVKGGGHTWPGGHGGAETTPLGPVNKDISASALVWEFFRRYSVP